MSIIVRLSFLTFLVFHLIHPTALSLGYINYTEFLTSVGTNDSYLNTLYFWWVNINYLSPLFFFFFYAAYLVGGIHSAVGACLFLCWSDCWFVELSDLLSANGQLVSVTTLHPTFNALLLNALNKYHPFIFYSSLSLYVAASLFFTLQVPRSLGYGDVGSVRVWRFSTSLVLTLNMFSLLLGSWWAMQEGTWGGWWNWDSSETFGLLPTLLLLGALHSRVTLASLWRQHTTSLYSVLIVVAAYCILQINFDLISHNFGARFFHFFNSNLVFIAGLVLSLAYLTFVSRSACTPRLHDSPNSAVPYFRRTYGTVLSYVVLSSWVIYSFFDFIELSDFLALRLVSVTGRVSFYDLNTSLCALLLLYFTTEFGSTRSPFWRVSPYVAPDSLLYTLGGGRTVATRSQVLHLFLAAFTLLTLLTESVAIRLWEPLYQNLVVDLTETLPTLVLGTYVCDVWGVEVSLLPSHTGVAYTPSWGRWDLSNYPSSDLFFLTTGPTTSSGSLYLAGSYLLSSARVESLWSPTLLTLAFAILGIYRTNTQRP